VYEEQHPLQQMLIEERSDWPHTEMQGVTWNISGMAYDRQVLCT